MWIPRLRPASCGCFINLSSQARYLHRHFVRRRKHCEKIQRLPIPMTGRHSNCLITNNKLNKENNLILDDVPVKANPDKPPYATLRLPYPSLPIQSLRRLTIPAAGLAGSTKPQVLNGGAAVQTATVQVLTYAFESDA